MIFSEVDTNSALTRLAEGIAFTGSSKEITSSPKSASLVPMAVSTWKVGGTP